MQSNERLSGYARLPIARLIAHFLDGQFSQMPKLSASGHNKSIEEKVAINLSVIDLGRVDLLIREGFYSNRSDLIRAAIRQLLTQHEQVLEQAVSRHMLVLGLRHITRTDLEPLKAAGDTIDIRVLGLLTITNDVSAELACDTINSITVMGAFHAPADIRSALADRIR